MTSLMSLPIDVVPAGIDENRELDWREIDPRKRAELGLWLTSGGDERISLDPVTRRNRYGVPAAPTPNEVWLSASTASAISMRSFIAVQNVLTSISGGAGSPLKLGAWFDNLRARLVAKLGIPGSDAILAASGTETELITLTLAKALMKRPISNVIVAPNETGNGVVQAAVGNHFANSSVFRSDMREGSRLSGWEGEAFSTIKIDIRNENGQLRDLAAIDDETFSMVEEAIRGGRDVLLHVLDASKTGQQAPSRSVARKISREFGDRVLIVIDACQMRCSFDEIRTDLEDGFMVMVTGSKFAGGPPFSGAVLVPPSRLNQLQKFRAPAGLSAYSAKFDWPSCMRAAVDQVDFGVINIGMGLRWEAALAEIEVYAAIPPHAKTRIASAFADTVIEFVGAYPHLSLLDEISIDVSSRIPSIFPIVVGDGDVGRTRLIYEALQTTTDDSARTEDARDHSRVCHLGQPVNIANKSAVRISSSMPLLNRVATRFQESNDFNLAFGPVREDIGTALRKCSWLYKRVSG